MAITNTTRGGVIGLGSRLFLRKESGWGEPKKGSSFATDLALTDWEQYNVYNQAGSRPQKVKNSIEVSQLYPSVVRRKTIKNTTQIEGSFVFSIPTTKSSIFWEMITGDTSPSGGAELTDALSDAPATALSNVSTNLNGGINATVTTLTVDNSGSVDDGGLKAGVGDIIKINSEKMQITSVDSATSIGVSRGFEGTTPSTHDNDDAVKNLQLVVTLEGTANITADDDYVGQYLTIAGVTTSVNADQVEIDMINGTHKILDSYQDTPDAIKTGLELEITGITIASVNTTASTVTATVSGNGYTLQEEITNSYGFIQTQGLSFASRYDGMMAQSATINISPDDVANVDISFLGKDETTAYAQETMIAGLFEGEDGITAGVASVSPLSAGGEGTKSDPYKITGIKDGAGWDGVFDNFVDYYPSFSASLYLAQKTVVSGNDPSTDATVTYKYLSALASGGGFTNADGGTTDTDYFALGDNVPGSDLLVPFADASITINNNLDFPAYINGTNTRTQPIQTTFRDVTIGLTLPYSEFTYPLIKSMFDEDSWACKLVLDYNAVAGSGNKKIIIEMPEMCITGDGGLGDIPEGEITIPLTFTAYAPHEVEVATGISEDGTGFNPVATLAPITIYVTE